MINTMVMRRLTEISLCLQKLKATPVRVLHPTIVYRLCKADCIVLLRI